MVVGLGAATALASALFLLLVSLRGAASASRNRLYRALDQERSRILANIHLKRDKIKAGLDTMKVWPSEYLGPNLAVSALFFGVLAMIMWQLVVAVFASVAIGFIALIRKRGGISQKRNGRRAVQKA